MVQLCKHDAEIAALEIDFLLLLLLFFLAVLKTQIGLFWLPKLYVIV